MGHDTVHRTPASMCKNEQQMHEPWLTPKHQVMSLKAKGVKFAFMTEEDAVRYLSENSNYFRIKSYKDGFPKYPSESKNAGKFIDLDFAMLVDLSIIDMLLRRQMLPMTLDIEHFAKLSLLNHIEQTDEDGYSIVSDFISKYDHCDADGRTRNRIKKDIQKGKSSPYVSNLIMQHLDFDFPVWKFIEVIAFGTFIAFYRFCAERFSDKTMRALYYSLQRVRSMRNACAHNNCILNDLTAGTAQYKPPHELNQALSDIKTIGRDSRRSRLSNARIQEIAITLHMHSQLASRGIHEHRSRELRAFTERMLRHSTYYEKNPQVYSTFTFVSNIVHAWF